MNLLQCPLPLSLDLKVFEKGRKGCKEVIHKATQSFTLTRRPMAPAVYNTVMVPHTMVNGGRA